MAAHKIETRQHDQGRRLPGGEGARPDGSIEPFDLELHEGEVVGLAGLLGSGRTEMAQLLFGIDRPGCRLPDASTARR